MFEGHVYDHTSDYLGGFSLETLETAFTSQDESDC